MTSKQRQKVMRDYVKYWSQFFRVTQDIGVKFDHYDDSSSGDYMPQYLRAEEQVVTQIERAIIGEKDWKRMMEAWEKYAPGTMGECATHNMHYNRAVLTFYDPLMKIDDDELFMLFGKSVSLHEVLHIVEYPLAAYCETLELKG